MTFAAEESNNLLVRLRKNADELLSAEGIYSILDYAWDGPDTFSEGYVGLAMWTTHAPFEPDLFWDRQTPPPKPTERDEIFHKAGEDFIGTMELARNSLGLSRYSWEHRKLLVLGEEEEFWEHRAATALWLNIASDRIRDYFVMARFGISTDKFKG